MSYSALESDALPYSKRCIVYSAISKNRVVFSFSLLGVFGICDILALQLRFICILMFCACLFRGTHVHY